MKKKPKPGFAPLYCGMYPELAKEVRKHGYALAIHGSLQRDFDLIGIPWIEKPSSPKMVVKALTDRFAIEAERNDPVVKYHGREVYTLRVSYGECFVDLSFMPIQQKQ